MLPCSNFNYSICYIFYRTLPSIAEIISVVLAFSGAAIIALQGQLSLKMFNSHLLFWELIDAVSVAIYTLQPVKLLKKYGTFYIVGWGLLIGSFASLFAWEPLAPNAIINNWTYICIAIMVILGTVLAFNLYLEGVSRLGVVQGSILSSVEPISAAFISWLALGTQYTTSDIVGFSMILATVFILAFAKGKRNNAHPVVQEAEDKLNLE